MAPASFRIALLAALGLAFVPVVSEAALPSRPATNPAPAVRGEANRLPEPSATPKPLAAAKRTKRFNALLTKLGHARLQNPPPNVDGLTPLTPALEDGAKIVRATDVDYNGPTSDAPKGVIWMHDRDYDDSRIELAWPTEVGKLYVLDCAAKVHYYDESGKPATTRARLDFQVMGVGSQTVTGVSGHVLHAFVAKETRSVINATFRKEQDLAWQVLAWYGCELVPAG